MILNTAKYLNYHIVPIFLVGHTVFALAMYGVRFRNQTKKANISKSYIIYFTSKFGSFLARFSKNFAN